MSSNDDNIDPPSEPVAIVQRYHRAERPVSWGVSIILIAVTGLALYYLPFLQALLVAAGVVAVARLPILRSYGTIELAADSDAETVRADFESATPPILAFQWALASDIESVSDGWVYEISYAFGLVTQTLKTEFRPLSPKKEEESESNFEILITENGEPWGTYTGFIEEQGEGTKIHIEYASDRRFGLRRFPQWLVAERYRDEALTVQGYSIIKRDLNLKV